MWHLRVLGREPTKALQKAAEPQAPRKPSGVDAEEWKGMSLEAKIAKHAEVAAAAAAAKRDRQQAAKENAGRKARSLAIPGTFRPRPGDSCMPLSGPALQKAWSNLTFAGAERGQASQRRWVAAAGHVPRGGDPPPFYVAPDQPLVLPPKRRFRQESTQDKPKTQRQVAAIAHGRPVKALSKGVADFNERAAPAPGRGGAHCRSVLITKINNAPKAAHMGAPKKARVEATAEASLEYAVVAPGRTTGDLKELREMLGHVWRTVDAAYRKHKASRAEEAEKLLSGVECPTHTDGDPYHHFVTLLTNRAEIEKKYGSSLTAIDQVTGMNDLVAANPAIWTSSGNGGDI